MTDKQFDIPKIHWNRITSYRLLVVLLVLEFAMFLSEHCYPKGWAALIATVIVIATTFYILGRYALIIMFHMPYQFSIRSMLIFTSIIAFSCGWMAQRVREATKQRQVLGLLGQGIYKEHDNLTPSCLRNLLGECFFTELSDAWECDLCGSNATDTDLEYLKRFKRLRILHIRGNPAITDAGLVQLKDLKQLTNLDLVDTNITDVGLKYVEALDNLQELCLRNTKITGTGLKHLVSLKNLRTLWFEKAVISDEGLNNIKKLTLLETLSLENTGITDPRLDFLKGKNNLHVLYLSGNHITDTGLQQFKELTQLRKLVLCETDITDACLPLLEELKQMEELYLYNTNITDSGLKQLSKYDNLKTLGLLGTKITDAGLKYISAMPQLKKVILHDTRTSIAGLKDLQKSLPTTEIDF